MEKNHWPCKRLLKSVGRRPVVLMMMMLRSPIGFYCLRRIWPTPITNTASTDIQAVIYEPSFSCLVLQRLGNELQGNKKREI